tara:strand:+ start:6421 stop:6921 length:501 start_codon:yes stop_codon:yes gene_type:complete
MADHITANIVEPEHIRINIRELKDEVELFIGDSDGYVKTNGVPLENQVAFFDDNNKRIAGDVNFTYDGSKVSIGGELEANSVVKTGGLSTEFLMADGSVSVAETTYTHDQGIPNVTWTIQHNLDKRPSVTVVDTGGAVVVGEVEYIDSNEVTVTFNAAFSGEAYLN